jgi:hypothetical protein
MKPTALCPTCGGIVELDDFPHEKAKCERGHEFFEKRNLYARVTAGIGTATPQIETVVT